ncbi:MAG: hypothetical protein PHQ12_14695 [Chthoniobacteraceae bacterium]|nr:hypothetical protein [Chthoniobacteraceae bacterium]
MSNGLILAGLVLAIFGAGWLNNQLMKNYIDAKFETVNTRFAAIEARLDRIERQLEAIFKPVLPPRS